MAYYFTNFVYDSRSIDRFPQLLLDAIKNIVLMVIMISPFLILMMYLINISIEVPIYL